MPVLLFPGPLQRKASDRCPRVSAASTARPSISPTAAFRCRRREHVAGKSLAVIGHLACHADIHGCRGRRVGADIFECDGVRPPGVTPCAPHRRRQLTEATWIELGLSDHRTFSSYGAATAGPLCGRGGMRFDVAVWRRGQRVRVSVRHICEGAAEVRSRS